ncbi:MAG TPA: DUF2630 family protein [Chloroflexota bacterium]|nr:DUF2630 family protein [Chloroflexota bacterium]
MEDQDLMRRIHGLDAEDHALLPSGEATMGLDGAERARLHELHVELERLWDLIRQQRARRQAGPDPEAAKLRSARVVEDDRR